jgi:hypothetical protein
MNNQATREKTRIEVQDNFFTPIGNTKPYFKAAFEGFAGAGKTYTAALVAVGLHKRIKSKKPVVIFDTEKSAKFLKPLFAENGIEVLVRESKSLGDLKITMQKMRNEGIADILIIDSISHVWEGFLKAYAEKVHRTSLQFQDWGIIKPTWKTEYSDPFVNDPYHIIMCGRAGYEYDFEKNEDTGKRELIKTGVKMKVEGETAYEPDILVLMNRFEEVIGKDKKVWREATIIKDRSTILDGKTFQNPTYTNFAPSIEVMLSNPILKGIVVMPESDTGLLFRTEEEKAGWRRERDKWLEELDGLLIRIAPGAVGRDKQLKLDLLDRVFGTTSTTAIGEMRPEHIAEGYKKLGLEAVAMGIAEIVELPDGRKRLVSKLSPNGNGNGNGNGHAAPAVAEKKPANAPAKKEAKKK